MSAPSGTSGIETSLGLRSRWLSSWTSGDIAAFDFSTCPVIISTCAFEQHGKDTMPLGTDFLLAQALTKHTISKMGPMDPGLFLDIQPFGYSPEHEHFPGTISLSYKTYLSLMLDIAASLARWGVRKVLISNFHGGNPPLNQVAIMEFKHRFGLIAAEYNYARETKLASELFGDAEAAYGYHAGAAEFALGLYLFPEHLSHLKRGNYPSTFPSIDDGFKALRMGAGHASVAWHTENASPSGAIGNSLAVTKEQGQTLADDVAHKIWTAIQDLNSPQLAAAMNTAPSFARENFSHRREMD